MEKRIIKKVILLFCLFVVLLLVAVQIAWMQGAFLPNWICWQNEKSMQIDQDNIRVRLSHRKAEVFCDGTLIWETDPKWKVQDVLACDIDHDEKTELLLLCWKVGRYGDHKPFWIKEDEKVWSQHIFIYDLEDKEVKAAWMSSYLPSDVAEWSFDTEKRLILKEPSGVQTRWDWLSWGIEYIG